MKLVSFSRLGKARFGAVVKDGVIDLTGKLDPDVNTIKELISLQIEGQALQAKIKIYHFQILYFYQLFQILKKLCVLA